MKPAFAHFHRHHTHAGHGHTSGSEETASDTTGAGAQNVGRRQALKLGAVGAAAAVATTVGTKAAAAQTVVGAFQQQEYGPTDGAHTNDMFDVDAVLGGAWDVSPYGIGDQRGTFNELTAERTSAALKILNRGQPVKTYQLGEEMFNGFPAFPSDPPRTHNMHLYVFGYEAPAGFVQGGGIQSGIEPLGPNLVSGHEERFEQNFTFQIATQIDGLNHIGVGEVYYGGFRGPQIASPTGTTALGNETMGPVTARGVIYDVVGLKVAQGKTEDYFMAGSNPVLRDDYHVTLSDLNACLRRQQVNQVGAGDIPILHTGWTHLARIDPTRYLTQEPGIYLAEARYFAERKVAFVASDTWGLEVLSPEITGGNAFPVHQELIVKNGVRIGESFVTDSAIADHCYEGVLIATPENVPGATCGSMAPAFMGQPGRKPRDV